MKNMHTGYHYNHCFPWLATNQPVASHLDIILHIYFCSHMTWKTAQLLWPPLTLGRSCYYIHCLSHSVSKLTLCYCVQKTSSVSSWMLVPLPDLWVLALPLVPCPPPLPGLEEFWSCELKTNSIPALQPEAHTSGDEIPAKTRRPRARLDRKRCKWNRNSTFWLLPWILTFHLPCCSIRNLARDGNALAYARVRSSQMIDTSTHFTFTFYPQH